VGISKGFAWVTLHSPSFRGKMFSLSMYDIDSFSDSVEWGISFTSHITKNPIYGGIYEVMM